MHYFEEKLANLEYPISIVKLSRILYNKVRLQRLNARYSYIMPLLGEQGRQRLIFELKDEAKLEKMLTEIHLLYGFATSNFNIDKPDRFDIFAESSAHIFNIEVYQPDISRSKYLREIERKAKITFSESVLGRETIARSYTIALNSKQLLKDIVIESIKKKRPKAQLTADDKGVKLLCVDLSDRSLTEKLELTDLEVLKYYDLSDFKALLDEWDVLNGFVLCMWRDELLSEKIGILINRDLDEEHIDILNHVITLMRVI